MMNHNQQQNNSFNKTTSVPYSLFSSCQRNQHLLSSSCSSLSSATSLTCSPSTRHGSSSLSGTSTHHNHHHSYNSHYHHHQSMFSIGRLRLALYFICILAITTSLYCLVSYKPDGLKSSAVAYNAVHYHHHQYPILLLTSTSQILDEVIHNANKYYLDYFHYRKTVPIPTTAESIADSYASNQELSSSNDELSKLIFMIDNLTQSSNQDDYFELHYSTNNNNYKNNRKYLQERDNLEYSLLNDEFDDPNSVEYHLLQLGFDLQHIIYLYALSHPENVSATSEGSESSPSAMLSGRWRQARYHQRYDTDSPIPPLPQLQMNLTYSLLPDEFLTSTIVFITAVNMNQFHLAIGFIKSFEQFRLYNARQQQSNGGQHKMQKFSLMIYDLGLYPEQLSEIEKLCNKTGSNHNGGHEDDGGGIMNPYRNSKLCEIRTFQFDIYPSHVSDLRMAAYRSIIIQEMLRDIKFTIKFKDHLHHKQLKSKKKKLYPKIASSNFEQNASNTNSDIVTLFWLDVQYRFINTKYHSFIPLINETLHQSGILSWPIEQPTSTLTHPRMFEYFHTTKENFYFHRMIRPGHLMISVDLERTWEPFQWGVLLPWVRCALTSNCIAPLGSQWRSTCRLDKKPMYRYSGCHHYDMSALNVVLGIAFNYSSSQYSAHLSRRFFTPFNKPPMKDAMENTEDYDDGNMFEYQFEDTDRSKVPGRFDLVLSDDDIPSDQFATDSSSKNFIFSPFSSSSSSSSDSTHQN